MDSKTIVFVGVKKALEAGHIDAAAGDVLAKLIAANEDKDLKIIDGHQASNLMSKDKFSEIRPRTMHIPQQSPVKPIQDRKKSF